MIWSPINKLKRFPLKFIPRLDRHKISFFSFLSHLNSISLLLPSHKNGNEMSRKNNKLMKEGLLKRTRILTNRERKSMPHCINADVGMQEGD